MNGGRFRLAEDWSLCGLGKLLSVAFPGSGLKTKKPYISLIHKVFTLFCSFLQLLSRVEDGARTHDLRNHNPTL